MDIIRLLSDNEHLSGWRVSTTKRTSYELFFVHRSLETVRSTDTEDVSVTVYVEHDGKMGSSDFSVYGSMTDEEAAEKIETAAARAGLVFNEPWELPEGGNVREELPSNFRDYSFPELGKKIADAVYAADNMEGGSINALEIFLYKDTVSVRNSRGVDKTQVKHHAMIEAIPTWNEDKVSVELYENYTFTEFDPDTITGEIAGKMKEVRDRQHAVKPETPLRCDVVLQPQEIMLLASGLARDTNYLSMYSHSNLHKVGDDLQPGDDCDKLNITLRGRLTGSAHSAFFDADGVDLEDRTIIADGKVTGCWGANRFARYMKEKPTGELGCLDLACGTFRPEDMTGPWLECVSLSGLQLDLYNDYIGGEIRLAYLHDGGTVTPVTGISMSGGLSAVLSTLCLSEKVTSIDRYHGPEKALLKDLSIL